MRFLHSYKECFVFLPNRCGISQTPPPPSPAAALWGQRSRCHSFPLQSMWDLPIHPLRGSAFSLAQRVLSSSDTICNSPNPPLLDIVLFELSLSGFLSRFFKTRLLGRSFHTLTNNVSFSSPTDVGSHNSPPFGAQRPRWHSFPSPIDVGPPNSPPLGLSVLAGTSPFEAQPSRWHLVFDSDTICNRPSPPLSDIVLFGLSLLGFSSRFF